MSELPDSRKPGFPKSNDDFIRVMAAEGAYSAKEYRYPLPALIACACGESGFGTSSIYRKTGCPFNLQKPAHFKWPKCKTMRLKTINKEGEKARSAPFCVADSLYDAARLWCEWIAHWPNAKARKPLESLRDRPVEFANALFLVAFAEGRKEKTKEFGDLIISKGLMRYSD